MKRIKKYLALLLIFACFFAPIRTDAMTIPINGFFSYGGIVLYIIPCLTSIVIIVGPPSPAIINYQPPITLPRPNYVPFIPTVKDLGNAFLGGWCFQLFGGFPVPTAYLLGSTLLP